MFPYAFAKIRQHQPAVRRLPETDRGAVRGVMLSSIPYHGKPTEVFAYIGYPAGAGPHVRDDSGKSAPYRNMNRKLCLQQ